MKLVPKSRRQRRQEARDNKVQFEPQYNSGVKFDRYGRTIKTGGKPKTHEEMYGVGYERFNNKFITIKEIEEKDE